MSENELNWGERQTLSHLLDTENRLIALAWLLEKLDECDFEFDEVNKSYQLWIDNNVIYFNEDQFKALKAAKKKLDI